MKKILLLVVIVIGVAFWMKPSQLPQRQLTTFPKDSWSETNLVGGSCPKEKCLSVYVAPWCPACKSLQPTIISLVNEMKSRDIPARVIVGKDKIENVEKYAASFPFPVSLDADGSFYKQAKIKAVPYFAVTNNKGEIVNSLNGGFKELNVMIQQLKLDK